MLGGFDKQKLSIWICNSRENKSSVNSITCGGGITAYQIGAYLYSNTTQLVCSTINWTIFAQINFTEDHHSEPSSIDSNCDQKIRPATKITELPERHSGNSLSKSSASELSGMPTAYLPHNQSFKPKSETQQHMHQEPLILNVFTVVECARKTDRLVTFKKNKST